MLAIIVSLLLTRVYVGMKLKQAISDQVAEASNNRYKLSIEKVSIGILAFNATISGIQLYCDTTKPMADSVPLMVNLSTQKIRLRNLNLLDLLRNKKITLRRLEIVAPEVQVILNPAFKPKVDKNEKFRLVSLNIGDFEMSDAVLKVKNRMGERYQFSIDELLYNLKNNEFNASDLDISSSPNVLDSLHLNIEKINLQGFNLDNLIANNVLEYTSAEINKMMLRVVKTSNTIIQKDSIAGQEADHFIAIKFKTNPFKIKESNVTFINKQDTQRVHVAHILFDKNVLGMREVRVEIKNKNTSLVTTKKMELEIIANASIFSLQRIALKKVFIDEPQISVNIGNTKETKKDSVASPLFPPVAIDLFKINKAHIAIQFAASKSQSFNIKNASISCNNIRLNSDSGSSSKFYFTDLIIAASGIDFNTKNNLYHLSIASFNYAHKKNEMGLSNLILKPNHDRAKFYTLMHKQVPMINLSLASLQVEKFELETLLDQNEFHCASVVGNNALVAFYKDKRIPLLASDLRKMPHQLMRDAGFDFDIDKIEIRNSVITSEVFGENALTSGKIIIDKVALDASHVCNIKRRLQQNDKMQVDFTGRLAQQGTMNAHAVLNLLSNDNSYNLTAEIGSMQLKALNNFISDVTPVAINTGNLENAYVAISGNDQEIKTKMKMRYQNLNVQILNYKKEEKNNKLQLFSNLANSMIINSNPEANKALREVEITTDYEANKFVINNWIGATLKAMLVTISPSVAKAVNVRNEKGKDGGRGNKTTIISRFLDKKKNK